ncbi:saccharopine dehydrogenase family protein [Natribaculum luteum]|uniref:Saccharopine dehydrogenase family protein n=1 Tax=Natribaculum luteum TaxID=1586232 RepID=A0ABD5NYD4_9EURY|nr:saccharopine dehydrogenase NADP-binding domain-containing protein [Natribaculum luteum]
MDDLLIYGSYGYTGRLIAREAVSRGGAPVVAGRDAERVAALADDLGVEGRAFDLESDVTAHLDGFAAVCNCAGPFVDTCDPLVEACLETGTDYLDVTGEVAVFERLARLGGRAERADVTLLPGVGFDVVPSDCLATYLHERLPSADDLAVGIANWGSLSRGTLVTTVRNLGSGGVVRRNGRLIRVPTAYDTRTFDFGRGPTTTVTVPLGDVVTAAHSTGVEHVAVYVDLPNPVIRAMKAGRSLESLLGSWPIRQGLERVVETAVDGPDAAERERGEAVVQVEVTDGDRTERARLWTPNTYALTADAAVSSAKRVLEGDAPDGYQTPSTAFGHEFVLDLEGVERELLPSPTQV